MRNWIDVLGWGKEEIDDLRFVAYSYIKEGIYDVAITFFDALEVLVPPTSYDLQTIGALHLQIGNGLKALDYLDRALKLDPTHLPTQINRAKALFMLGYKRQGVVAAMELEKNENKEVKEQAAALLLAYR
ncbi:MAG TPA: type III secretion chaperone [Chlamydiales bacterium]|nr:type III secretion chaperone [Chlamydiales bacterium]